MSLSLWLVAVVAVAWVLVAVSWLVVLLRAR